MHVAIPASVPKIDKLWRWRHENDITFLNFNLAVNHALMGRYDLSAVEVRKIAKREEAIERINKKIYEIITHKGYVKVTEDHSLLDNKGNEISPKDCIINNLLLHAYPKFEIDKN